MKTKNKNTILAIIVSIVASVIPALIFGKWLEAIIFLVCHTLIRPQYPKQYHHIIPACCRIITASTFFFGVCFILPLELSLLSAIPIPDPTIKRNRIILKGDLPSPSNPPEGCKFNTRCPYADSQCMKVKPEYKEVKKGHFVACHKAKEV